MSHPNNGKKVLPGELLKGTDNVAAGKPQGRAHQHDHCWVKFKAEVDLQYIQTVTCFTVFPFCPLFHHPLLILPGSKKRSQ